VHLRYCQGPALVRGGPYPRIRASRSRIAEEQDALLELRRKERLSYRELAARTGMSKSTVGRRLHGMVRLLEVGEMPRCDACGRLPAWCGLPDSEA